jgi:hypothetical protein
MTMFFSFFGRRCFTVLLFIFALGGSLYSQNALASLTVEPQPAGVSELSREPRPYFPAAYFTEFLAARERVEAGRPYWVPGEAEIQAHNALSSRESILLNSDILAFYGHPRSRNMGILGRFSKEELDEKLTALAAAYQTEGGRKVRKAFYIIFGTVWPEGNIGIIADSLLEEYVEFALKNDILIIIDHQIGRFTPAEAMTRMLPWLRYPNVHLALDPEWRTLKPMEEIGTVSSEEINQVQRIMENYMIENHIPGERLLVIHQFNWCMISGREKVQSNFSKVRLVHCADGFGQPAVKRSSYAFNAKADNMPVKGFKLFYNFGIPGAGYDNPLLTPKEVFELNPRPYVIMYQ